jgi:hypothetical protein
MREGKQIRGGNIAQSVVSYSSASQAALNLLPPISPLFCEPSRCVPKALFLTYLLTFIDCLSRDIRTLWNSHYEYFTAVVWYNAQQRYFVCKTNVPTKSVAEPSLSILKPKENLWGVLKLHSVKSNTLQSRNFVTIKAVEKRFLK